MFVISICFNLLNFLCISSFFFLCIASVYLNMHNFCLFSLFLNFISSVYFNPTINKIALLTKRIKTALVNKLQKAQYAPRFEVNILFIVIITHQRISQTHYICIWQQTNFFLYTPK